jgi:adenine phosphoribosyltransferase
MYTEELMDAVRDVNDFPEPGIVFKDITPILKDPVLFRKAIEMMSRAADVMEADVILGIDSRGFLFGAAMAHSIGTGMILARKAGKLPGEVVKESFGLEYGSDTLEMQADSIEPGQRVLIVDDILATGGTAKATAKLVKKLGGEVAGFAFFGKIDFLEGDKVLDTDNIFSLLHF